MKNSYLRPCSLRGNESAYGMLFVHIDRLKKEVLHKVLDYFPCTGKVIKIIIPYNIDYPIWGLVGADPGPGISKGVGALLYKYGEIFIKKKLKWPKISRYHPPTPIHTAITS